jgi:nucleoside-diphosphate-sugar epimerase
MCSAPSVDQVSIRELYSAAMITFSNKTRILVTGGTGHLGSALIHHLVQNLALDPAAIRVFYLSGSTTRSLRDIPGLDFAPGNILNPGDVERACGGVEHVFHMAGSTTFDPRHKGLQWMINVEGTRHVLEAVRRSPTIRKTCFTSTVNVLGVPNPAGSVGNIENSNPYTSRPRLHTFRSRAETLSFIDEVRDRPRSRWEKRIGLGYFDSKLAAQELVSRYVRDFGLNAVSVLPGTCFGPHDALVGNGIYLLRIYHGKMPGILKGGFSATHVMDVAEGHLQCMASASPGSSYIISGRRQDNLHFADITGIIADVLGRRYPEKKIKRPWMIVPLGLAYAAAHASELASAVTGGPCLLSRAMVKAGAQPLFYTYEDAERDLGYRPKRTFRQAVNEMAAYYEKEGFLAAPSL